MSALESLKKLTLENYYSRLCAIVARAFGKDVLSKHNLGTLSHQSSYDENTDRPALVKAVKYY